MDDVRLPGMLHSAILRSPFAHARINSIDTSAALELAGVHAVITGADLDAQGLAWMPTLAGDTQAVLATDKVRFQGQEVAFVVADDKYVAQDALELIEVDYEPLDAIVDSRKSLEEDAPIIRDDKEGKEDNPSSTGTRGTERRPSEAFEQAEVTVQPGHVLSAHAILPRWRPAGRRRLRRLDRRDDHLHDLPGAARPQDALRHSLGAAGTPDPDNLARHRRGVREQGPDLPRLRLRHRGLLDHGPSREVDGERARRT